VTGSRPTEPQRQLSSGQCSPRLVKIGGKGFLLDNITAGALLTTAITEAVWTCPAFVGVVTAFRAFKAASL
jgi:hypothetical protein